MWLTLSLLRAGLLDNCVTISGCFANWVMVKNMENMDVHKREMTLPANISGQPDKHFEHSLDQIVIQFRFFPNFINGKIIRKFI